MSSFTESIVEQVALAWLESLGWRVTHCPDIAPDELAVEQTTYKEVVPHNFSCKRATKIRYYVGYQSVIVSGALGFRATSAGDARQTGLKPPARKELPPRSRPG